MVQVAKGLYMLTFCSYCTAGCSCGIFSYSCVDLNFSCYKYNVLSFLLLPAIQEYEYDNNFRFLDLSAYVVESILCILVDF